MIKNHTNIYSYCVEYVQYEYCFVLFCLLFFSVVCTIKCLFLKCTERHVSRIQGAQRNYSRTLNGIHVGMRCHNDRWERKNKNNVVHQYGEPRERLDLGAVPERDLCTAAIVSYVEGVKCKKTKENEAATCSLASRRKTLGLITPARKNRLEGVWLLNLLFLNCIYAGEFT